VWFTGDNIVSLLDILTVAFSVDNTVLSCGIAKESDIIREAGKVNIFPKLRGEEFVKHGRHPKVSDYQEEREIFASIG
jgi:hypothetical protein